MHLLEPAWEVLKREFDEGCSRSARAARSRTVQEFNQLVRRLRQYRNEGEWVSSVLAGAGDWVEQVALLALRDGVLRMRGRQNVNVPEDLSFPIESAAAFVSAVETRDPVTALRLPSEVGPALSTENAGDRAHIFPVSNGSRVVAFLFAGDTDETGVHALEFVANIASLVLERQSNSALHAHIAPASEPVHEIQKPHGNSAREALPAWADLSEQERNLHIRAQRFSRVKVAEMQLARPDACRAGREQNNLYVFLRPELDKARDEYRRQFMSIPSMVDYLHIELVRTATGGDELKLGAEYPGQLV